jgi:cytochrome c oxidase subunit 3
MPERLVTESSPSVVEHQFEDRHQQKEASTLGMWTFLATEVLFFGTLFVSYAIYRHQFPDAFRQGSLELKWYLGAINTAVLLISSFCMALAVHAASVGSNARIIRYLILTIAVAMVFLAIKATEYYLEYRDHLVPALNFSATPPFEEQLGAVASTFGRFDRWLATKLHAELPGDAPRNPNEKLFMLFYFVMTAIHATHMIIGIAVMLVLIWMAKRRKFSREYHNPVECFGLYWHFVDIVWVFLFPALYLLRNP